MGKGTRRVLLLGLLVFACRRDDPPPFLLGGIQVNEQDPWHWIDTLDRIGMNTVATTVYAKHGDWDSANLWHEPAPAVIAEIREAKRAGLSVVLVLRVALDSAFPRNRFLWHGMIMPSTAALRAEWFRRYREFAVEWARIAAREGVDVFAIGSEMNALASTLPSDGIPQLEAYYLSKEKQAEYEEAVARQEDRIEARHLAAMQATPGETTIEFVRERAAVWESWARAVTEDAEGRERELDREWRGVIAAVRAEYRGPVTYGANFDQYQRVGFWDALDLIGINAYFKLRTDAAPPEPVVLEAGWARVLDDVERFRRDRRLERRPVLFTELGFTYRKRSTVEPWSQAGFSVVDGGEVVLWADEPQDFSERAAAVRALHQARARHPELLAGILYWKLSTDLQQLPMEPFVLIVDEDPIDPLQTELLRFMVR